MDKITTRGLMGDFYLALEQAAESSWVGNVAARVNSDQELEEYAWLGQSPVYREWIGGRQGKTLREDGQYIRNKTREVSLSISVDDLRRAKYGQLQMRIRDLAERTIAHPARLLSTLILSGESATCYDGQFFFDTDHSEGDSGTLSNDITSSASTPAAPTAGEMESGVLKTIETMMGFKDDQGEPINENARSFTLMVPVPYFKSAAAAIGSTVIVDGSTSRTNTLMTLGSMGGYNINLAVNPRLTWTTKMAVFRADGSAAPFIHQVELEDEDISLDENSEYAKTHNQVLLGLKRSDNVGFGFWQYGCLCTYT